jgi:hypothetical protein
MGSQPGATQCGQGLHNGTQSAGATHCTANRGYTMVLSQQGLWYSVSGGYTMVLSQQGLHNGTGTQSAGATQWYSASRGYTMVPVLSQRGLHNGATQWYSASRGYTFVHMYLGYLLGTGTAVSHSIACMHAAAYGAGAVRACMRCVHACDGWHCWHARPQQQPVGACSGGRT